MNIASVNNLSMSNQSNMGESNTSNELDENSGASLKNEFLTLMIAQIQNQDPLNPLDGAEYVSQLAQFSQVESTEQVAQEMRSSTLLLNNMQNLATSNLVGKQVFVPQNNIAVNGAEINGAIKLDQPTSGLFVVFENILGQSKKVPIGGSSTNYKNFSLNPADIGLFDGNYKISIEDTNGKIYEDLSIAGKVNSVVIPPNGGTPLLNVDNIGEIPFYQVNQFSN